ncbi:hypothetical protein Tco_0339450 [Tanacetum coccineum]
MCDAVRIQVVTPSEAFEMPSGSAISSKPINRGLIQSIPTSLPPQPIGEATKASNLRRKPSGVQGRSHFTYLLYLIVQIRILLWFRWIFLDYRVTLGFGNIAGGMDHVSPIIRQPIERGNSMVLGRNWHTISRVMAEVDINTLTMEQYLTLSRDNQAPGVVKHEIGGNVNFKIKSQFMRELREDTFSGNKDEDAHDHIDRVLSIVRLFNIPGVSNDAVMLRVFPFTLTGGAKRWDITQKTEVLVHLYEGKGRPSLEELLNKHQEESARRSSEIEVWIKKLQENAKINTRNQSASVKNLETQIEKLTKELHSTKTCSSPPGQIKIVNTQCKKAPMLNNLHRESFITDTKNDTSEVLQC